jgi:hypothetical protein
MAWIADLLRASPTLPVNCHRIGFRYSLAIPHMIVALGPVRPGAMAERLLWDCDMVPR